MRFERVEVDFDDQVEIGLGVGLNLGVRGQEVFVGLGEGGDPCPLGGVEIGLRTFVVGEDGGRRPELGAHVGDGALAGGRDRRRAGTEVLDDAIGAALDGENAEQLENHVFWRCPALEAAGELDPDDLRLQDLPVKPGHDIDGVGATNADCDHPEATGVGGVRVGADHHAARESVVLEHHLVDDAGARFPEPEPIAGRRRLQEVVDLAIAIDGGFHVLDRARFREDQMVAVNGGRHRRRVPAGEHELEESHLRGGVLHRDPVGPQLEVCTSPIELIVGIGQVSE